MSKLPIPHLMADTIYDINPDVLKSLGISTLFLDVDNTIAPYSDNSASLRLTEWINGLKNAGIEPYILSNNRGERPELFAKALDIEYVGKAWKPFTPVLKKVMARKGISPHQAAIIGDQIYTDILCGKAAGLYTIVVRPISLENPLLAARYHLEAPFRVLYKLK